MDLVVKKEDIEDSIITLEDFPFICRICLMRNDLKSFEEECLVNLFYAITKIEVRSLEEFSSKVCNDCIRKLEDISLFIKMAKNNKNTLGMNSAMGEASKSESVHECLGSYQESVKSSLQGSQICRICLSPSGSTSFEGRAHLIQLFRNLMGDNVESNLSRENVDGICNMCIKKLEEISLFISSSIDNDKKLGEITGRNTAAEIESCSNPIGTELSTESDSKLGVTKMNLNNLHQSDSVLLCKEKHEIIDIKEEIIDSNLLNSTLLNDENTAAEIESCSNPIGTDLSTEFDCKLGVIKIINQSILHQSASVLLCKDKQEMIDIKEEIIDSDLSNSNLLNNQNEYKCSCCNQSFANHSDYERHLQEKPYKCDFCERRFLKRSSLSCHQTKIMKKCDFCDRIFPCSSVLKIHRQTHTGEKHFKCDFCEKRYAKNSKLQEHLRSAHTGDKPFKCDYCDKRSSRSSDMIYHVRSHIREKQLKCDYCDKCFSTSYRRKIHLRIHTGEKPYKCDYCDKSFISHSDMKIHVRTHTGEKPYKCDYCDRRFSRSSHRNSHMRTSHDGEKLHVNVISANGVL